MNNYNFVHISVRAFIASSTVHKDLPRYSGVPQNVKLFSPSRKRLDNPKSVKPMWPFVSAQRHIESRR